MFSIAPEISSNDSPSEQDISTFWGVIFFSLGQVLPSDNVSLDGRFIDELERLYFDQTTNLGCRIGKEGTFFLDIREATATLHPEQVRFIPVDLENVLFNAQQLTTVSNAVFNSRLDILFRDIGSATDFYDIDEEMRCLRAIGCTTEVRQIAEELLQIAFDIATGLGGELENMTDEAAWLMWTAECVDVDVRTGELLWYEVPESLQERQDAILRVLGCRLLQQNAAPQTDGEVVAEKLKEEWAYQHVCHCQKGELRLTSAHQVSNAEEELNRRIKPQRDKRTLLSLSRSLKRNSLPLAALHSTYPNPFKQAYGGLLPPIFAVFTFWCAVRLFPYVERAGGILPYEKRCSNFYAHAPICILARLPQQTIL